LRGEIAARLCYGTSALHHPARRGRKHRSGKCDSQQARAKHDKTGNGHREETVRSEFFAHGTPPTARKSDCQQDQLHVCGHRRFTPALNSSISGPPPASLRLATCNRPFDVISETRTIEIDGSILRRYASDTERVQESYTEVLARAGERDPAWPGCPRSGGVNSRKGQRGRDAQDRPEARHRILCGAACFQARAGANLM
jgi:hypothetical protein